MLHLITITNCDLTQEQIHEYFSQNYDKVITQKEFHKSGLPHFHILIESNNKLSEITKIVNILNPPVNSHTNDIRYNVNSISGTYCYVTKDKKINKPLYYGFVETEVNKIITNYRKNNKNILDPYQMLAEKSALNMTQSWDAIKDYFYYPSSKYLPLIRDILSPYMDNFTQLLLDYDYLTSEKSGQNVGTYLFYEKKYLHLYNPDRYIYSYLQLLHNGISQEELSKEISQTPVNPMVQ